MEVTMELTNKPADAICDIPPASKVREQLSERLREVDLLRRLLRLAERAEKARRREATK